MINRATHYLTGEEIHAGDNTTLGGVPGTIVFVLGFNDAIPEFRDGLDWYAEEYGSGFMFRDIHDSLIFTEESDEDYVFISRAEPAGT